MQTRLQPVITAVCLGVIIALIAFQPKAEAEENGQPPTNNIPYLAQAIELGYESGLTNIVDLTHTSQIHIKAGNQNFDALAQYQPLLDSAAPDDGILTVGTNVRQYKQEYNYFSTIYDRSQKPDFDQYMTVFILLSLANESAHRQQHLNGSLADYLEYMNHQNPVSACTLYALQQHVSDVLMIDNALKIQNYFLGHGYASGIRALHLVLEKMEVKNAFDEMQKAMTKHNSAALKAAMHSLYLSRLKANMSPRPECRNVTTTRLENRIYKRAIEPAQTLFSLAYTTKDTMPETRTSPNQ